MCLGSLAARDSSRCAWNSPIVLHQPVGHFLFRLRRYRPGLGEHLADRGDRQAAQRRDLAIAACQFPQAADRFAGNRERYLLGLAGRRQDSVSFMACVLPDAPDALGSLEIVRESDLDLPLAQCPFGVPLCLGLLSAAQRRGPCR